MAAPAGVIGAGKMEVAPKECAMNHGLRRLPFKLRSSLNSASKAQTFICAFSGIFHIFVLNFSENRDA